VQRLGITVLATDRPGLLRDLAAAIAEHGANIEAIHHASGPVAEMHLDLAEVAGADALCQQIGAVPGVISVQVLEAMGDIFGKRVIVIGGGAQVAQVVLGAVSEADRHNIRGERISVDTMPLVGEQRLADAVRAVARLPRARILVLAGSIMGGKITEAVRELRAEHHIPVISLNMVGSVVDAVDLVVSDPVQAGVMSVMAIADTASFDIHRLQNRRL
jgi:energy-converting hydrogenase B subunit Q